MRNHFKNYWVIWVVQLLILSAFIFLYWGNIHLPQVIGYVVYEMVFILIFLIKTKTDNRTGKNKIIDVKDDKIVIKGIFRKLEINKDEIQNLRVHYNFIAKVFDWNQVIITTKSQKEKLYTKQITAVPPLG